MEGFGVYKFMSVLMIMSVLCVSAMTKECTNRPSQTASHSFRFALLSSNNETWKQQVFAHYHLTPTDDSAWSTLLPRKLLTDEDELNWSMMYRKMKVPFESSGDFLKEVSLHDVRLDPTSFHWQAQQTNLQYLLMLDVDRLVWSFRKTAGLATPGVAYGGWEDPTMELRGHFVGHYLSASAQMWASTHNDNLQERMSAVVSALSECQQKIGTGYLSAFPSEFFDRFEALQWVWAPYYTIHKIMAGLLDQYTFAGNAQALKMTSSMADYFFNRVQNVIKKYTVERHYRSLNEETGGMNDVLYRLFSITRDSRHIVLAHLFDKPCFLGLLAVQAEDISEFHANTHIPIVVGSQMRYEITGDTLYREMGAFFMDIVNSSHSYATGGTSVREFWSDPKRLATTLQSENEESCTTYNMLKVSRNLFRWTKEEAYADYYERAVTNGVLGIQRGIEPGVMIYTLPLSAGGSKGKSNHSWGTPFNSFWCCYGTGIESFSKLGDSIYFEEVGQEPSLYVTQFIPSSLNWRSGQITINQTVDPITSFDPYVRVTLSISSKAGTGKSSTLNLRIPIWTKSDGAKAAINGESLPLAAPGTFLSINRKWSSGDTISLELPIYLRTEAIKDDRPEYESLQAILYGPYLLAGHSAGKFDTKPGSSSSLSDWITPVHPSDHDHLVTFSLASGGTDLVLSNTNHSITLQKFPDPGTEGSVHATFRLVSNGSPSARSSETRNASGQLVMLEPYDVPGMFITHNDKDNSLIVSDSSSTFSIVPGLDRKNGTVSIESVDLKGCYVFSDLGTVKLGCGSDRSSSSFGQGASFVMNKGLSEYHPISFVAKGEEQNFLLAPLMSFRDETYTVYFNI